MPLNAQVRVSGVGGSRGAAGRGITSVSINGSGNLILTFSDSTTQDAGHVVGAAGSNGTNGSNGAAGRGISSATINGSGDLVLTYTDSSTANVGHVAGAAGANGTNGSNGTNGADGTTWTAASGAPTSSANDIDFYLNVDDGWVYSHSGGDWHNIFQFTPGANGRGLTSITVDDSNHLIVTYTDSTTDDLGPLPDGGGGGGVGDVTMPVPSAPFLFNSHGMNGIGWDGKDVDGNPMPTGFQRIAIQKQANVYADEYTDLFGVNVSSEVDTNPFDIDGFSQDGTFQVSGNALIPGTSVGNFISNALGPNNGSSAYVDAGSDRVRITMVCGPSSTAVYGLVNFDDVASPTANGVLIFFSTGGATIASITSGNVGASTTITFDNPDTTGPVTFEMLDGTVTAFDSSNVQQGTGSIGGSSGTQAGFAISPGGGGSLISFALAAKAITPGDWTEVGGLSTSGAALTSVSGTVRFVAINTVGSSGTGSASTSIAYPALPPHAIADQTDVSFTNLQQYDAFLFDGTHWTNAQPLFTQLQELTLTNPSAGDFLRQNSENGNWINSTSATEGTQDTVGTGGGASSLPEAPATYLQFKGPDGTVYAVPAYPLT